MMTCNHCLRQFQTLHCGSGGMLCCQCVHVWRMWLSLEKRGTDQHNKYAEELLTEHEGGKICSQASSEGRIALPMRVTRRTKLEGNDALEFLDGAGSGWIRDAIEDAVLDADEIE